MRPTYFPSSSVYPVDPSDDGHFRKHAQEPLMIRKNPLLLTVALLASSTAITACDSVSDLAGGSTDLSTLGASSADELLENLMDVVTERVGANDLALSDNLTQWVTDFVRGGVDSLIQAPSATGVSSAENSLGGFVDQLLAEANIKDGVADMSAGQFDSLTQSICPLPPFCE